MSLLVFQHVAAETPALLGAILQNYGHRLRVVALYAGEPIPLDLDDVDGIISMGGPMNVADAAQYPWIAPEMAYLKTAHEAGVPIVGICLGAQLLATALGGEVAAMPTPEVGWHPVNLAFPGTTDPIYGGITWKSTQLHLHGQEVTKLPSGAVPLAGSKQCRTQAFRVGLRSYGFQYHFEYDRADIEWLSRDPMVAAAGANAPQIVKDISVHFDAYRRLGDRLGHNLAMLLFPIEKR